MFHSEVQLADIQAAAQRIQNYVNCTPLRRWNHLERQLKWPSPIYLKLENFQSTGSFKARGAANKILRLIEKGQKPSRIVAASAGNHAQGVAYMAGRLGIPATIVMPEGAPLVKYAATRDYGADVIQHGSVYDEAYNRAQEVLKSTPGSVYVHAYEDVDVICGQATAGLESYEQLKEAGWKPSSGLQAIIPIGGGGLICGVATALRCHIPEVSIHGVVCDAAPAMALSLESGKIVQSAGKVRTLAEGLAVKKVSALTFDMIRQFAAEIAIVQDDDLAVAISTLMERGKIIVEGSGAAGVAAMMSQKIKKLDPNKPTLIMICGGNIDMNIVSNILERSFNKNYRWVSLPVRVDDRPGQLAKIAAVIGEHRANILEIRHDRTTSNCPVGKTVIHFHLETHGIEHVRAIHLALETMGAEVLSHE